MMSRDPVVTRWHPPCALASADGAHVHSLHASLVGVAGGDPVDALDDGSGGSRGIRPGLCLSGPVRDPPDGERLRRTGRGAFADRFGYRRLRLVRERGRVLRRRGMVGDPTDEDQRDVEPDGSSGPNGSPGSHFAASGKPHWHVIKRCRTTHELWLSFEPPPLQLRPRFVRVGHRFKPTRAAQTDRLRARAAYARPSTLPPCRVPDAVISSENAPNDGGPAAGRYPPHRP